MRLTQFTDYGLRVLMYLASRESEQPPELLVEVAAQPSSLQSATQRFLLLPQKLK